MPSDTADSDAAEETDAADTADTADTAVPGSCPLDSADSSALSDTAPLTDTADSSVTDSDTDTGDGCKHGYRDTDFAELYCGGCGPDEYCEFCGYVDTATWPYVDYYACMPCDGSVCGRPLRVQQTPTRASALSRADWSDEPPAVDLSGLSAAERAALAGWWASQALDEHASVGSFARFTLELLAHGAPERLVRAAQQAGLEEVGHARDAFALASAFAGRRVGPGPMDGLSGRLALSDTLEALIVGTFVDGCLNETLATALATAQRDRATDPTVRAVLERVVAEETQHARLAWETVAWGLQMGGEPVRKALLEALEAYRLPEPQAGPAVPSHGLIAPAEARTVLEQAWAQVIAPVAAALLGAAQIRGSASSRRSG